MDLIGAGQQAASTGDVTVGAPVDSFPRRWTDGPSTHPSPIHPGFRGELSTDRGASVHGPGAVHPQSCPQMWVETWWIVDPG